MDAIPLEETGLDGSGGWDDYFPERQECLIIIGSPEKIRFLKLQ
jgi:hypothetical protein